MTLLPETWMELLRPVVAGVFAYGAIVLLTRASGQRMFSKIWAFDLAVTVSIGSLLASITISQSVALLSGLVALVTVFSLQLIMARLRATRLIAATANPPLLLMDGPLFVDANLDRAKITRSDVMAELRQKGILRLDEVRAVVMESNGQISVLAGSKDPDAILLEGVRQGSRR